MRTFPVQMPSGMRYWTVIGEDLLVMSVADAYLRYLRFGRDAAESTTLQNMTGRSVRPSPCDPPRVEFSNPRMR
jgi:hypothetical protein